MQLVPGELPFSPSAPAKGCPPSPPSTATSANFAVSPRTSLFLLVPGSSFPLSPACIRPAWPRGFCTSPCCSTPSPALHFSSSAPGRRYGCSSHDSGSRSAAHRQGEAEPGSVESCLQLLREAFEDVALYFTRKEWELLGDGDKALYRDQMLRNYQALVSLGCRGPAPDLIGRIQRGEVELWVCVDEHPRRHAWFEGLSPGSMKLSRAELQPRGEELANLGLIPARNQLLRQWGQRAAEPQKSPVCQEGFKEQRDLKSHEGSTVQAEALYICGECGKSFWGQQELQAHDATHVRELAYPCLECGKSFRYKYCLIDHRRTHSGEHPHVCQDCGKSFPRPSHLQVHRRIHTGEKPYGCKECGKNFAQRSSLTKHWRVHSTEKPYHCSDCGKSFNDPSYLHVHQRLHTGEKPYICGQCGKNFYHTSHLRSHQRLHTGEKPYGCGQCGHHFRHRTSLIEHQRLHTGEKPYLCVQCGVSFRHSSSLTKHQGTHRPDPHL